MKPIVVAGSLNMDFVVQMKNLPQPGQTVPGWGFLMVPGGKGANQACAAGKLGGKTFMAGRVGDDVFGERLKESLEAAGVDTGNVLKTPGEPTGVALIFVQEGGQNQIVVAAGSNGLFQKKDVAGASNAFQSGGFLLLQLESPLETVEAAAALGKSQGMVTVLDPAPARPLSPSILKNIDILTPNESEALVLLNRQASSVSLDEAPEIASQLRRLGPKCIILKMGDKGAWLADEKTNRNFPSIQVDAVDATAAGDTFNGALAVALSEGKSMEEAIPFSNCAAAISVTRLGAQASIPSRAEVEARLRNQL